MRIDYAKIEPELTSRFRQLTRDLAHTAIDHSLRALVELRVSQINGCTYCIQLHQGEAQKLGEAQARIEQLAEWRSSALFTPREQAALAWAEALTYKATVHDDAQEYACLTTLFSDEEIVALGFVVSLANFWNRMAGGFRK
ncbi:carboxymuconolactone decarboxylase family protein [Prosthecobacter fluviatilis]|uniref:Carboxymuconolactone decarboxylase family protein n=1 Tax=Prosthecobacter fluviatilis TaxID=445931 RepID=A0ABW0KJW4_9BACT